VRRSISAPQPSTDFWSGSTTSTPTIPLTATSYQQFAITDDAIIFFFNQDGLLPHEEGPLEVTVPRSQLAPVLA
jgi:hypothetical protein